MTTIVLFMVLLVLLKIKSQNMTTDEAKQADIVKLVTHNSQANSNMVAAYSNHTYPYVATLAHHFLHHIDQWVVATGNAKLQRFYKMAFTKNCHNTL